MSRPGEGQGRHSRGSPLRGSRGLGAEGPSIELRGHLPMPDVQILMSLAHAGVSSPELRRRVDALAAELGLNAVEIEPPGNPGDSTQGPSDWEILLLGPGLEANEIPPLLARILDHHALGFILVLVDNLDPVLRAEWIRQGAFEVLSASTGDAELRLAIERAIDLYGRLDRYFSAGKLQVISQLAASVNHEINNPLTGLMGTAEIVLMENPQLAEKTRRDLKTILAQAHRIQIVAARLRHLDHLRTIPYDENSDMLDLLGTDLSDDPAASMADDEIFRVPRLLVVDDNPLIIELIERALADRFTVLHATRGSEAIRKTDEEEFDLILLDLVMPEVDGLELFRSIRRIRPRQKIMISTAYHSDPRLKEAVEAGAIGWIKKPFNFEEVEQRLWSALKPA